MTYPLDPIQQIVEAEPFVLNDAIVVRVLDLLAEAVVTAGEEGVVVKVPGLGTLEAKSVEGRMVFQLCV